MFKTTKKQLFSALGKPLCHAPLNGNVGAYLSANVMLSCPTGAQIGQVIAIARESGDGHSYNVTLLKNDGATVTVYVRTVD